MQEDTSETIRLQDYKPGSNNTSQGKVQLWDSFPHNTLERRSMCFHREMKKKKNHKNQAHFAGSFKSLNY